MEGMGPRSLALPALLLAALVSAAQSPHAVPDRSPIAGDASLPAPRHIHDARYGLSFELPAGWNTTQKDRDLSTFALDARTSGRFTQMRDTAQLAFNPFPASTFSGALFYFSATPRSSPRDCTNQASAQAPHMVSSEILDRVTFAHGYDEHGTICTESRDDVYTALRNGSCLRFDLVLNTFCGGDVSGVRNMTDDQIAAVRKRLEGILQTVHFDSK